MFFIERKELYKSVQDLEEKGIIGSKLEKIESPPHITRQLRKYGLK